MLTSMYAIRKRNINCKFANNIKDILLWTNYSEMCTFGENISFSISECLTFLQLSLARTFFTRFF